MSKKYFAERNNLSEVSKFSIEDLNNIFHIFYVELEKKQYFRRLIGSYDVAGHYYRGIIDLNDCAQQELFVFIKTKIRYLFPILERSYSESEIFCLIEFLYDYVEEYNGYFPVEKENRIETGREAFRSKFNPVLNAYGKGWELTKEGYIRELVDEGYSELINQPYNNVTVYSEIQKTKQNFLRYGATLDDKKDALIRLGNIIEPLREEMKIILSKEDTSDIFNLLNNFQLRHNNVKQKTDYDKEIYYPWMFYQMLAALNAFLKIKEQEE